VSNLKLVPDDPTPMEKLLLDASRAEQPSDEHKQRMMALLGIGLPLSGPLAAPAPVAPGQAAASMAPVASAGKSAMLAKVALGVGVVALLGAVVLTQKQDAVQPPRAAVKPSVAVHVTQTPAPIAPAEAAPAVSPLPPVEVEKAPQAPATRGARPDASAAADADLGEQIRLIEAARAGVASHNAKAATAALDAYAAKFPRGSFGQEAMVLRIRAIDQAGDSTRASALAKSFVTRFPNSPHVARLKPIAERGASR
jgi:hypothetical protein